MTDHATRTCFRYLGIALLGITLGQPVAQAASGSYQGIIDSDSGLGLIGQTMRVDFAYDSATSPSSSFADNSLFDGFLTSMTVKIGASTWNWDPSGYSSVFLYNDTVINFSTGVEDRFTAFIGTFNGTSIVASPVDPQAYSLDIYLYDNSPTGSPNGLTAHATLPATAPNPDLFRIDGINQNTMGFSFYTGNPETGDRYSISAKDVSPVPEPSAVLMLLAGLGMVGMAARRRSLRS